ncbi:hypothetical protein [Massilia sp. DWR3-1-1]|uniref:hypothetical protein n=1 Tax=Massilia sp. DWR3-1-1 TaxID=2804559 RepID=UPI003CF8C94F
MPALIDHIDAIARAQQRAVLWLEFHPHEDWRRYRFETDATRERVLGWLDQQQFGWRACGPFADPDAPQRHLGQVCLDVPFDDSVPAYCALRDYLEFADGSMRHAGVRFNVMPLDYAQRNAAHDAPGFWERYWDLP